MWTLFAHPHLGKLVRSLKFTVIHEEEHDGMLSLISTTRNDAVRNFTSLAPHVISLDFRDPDWPVEEYLPALSSVAPRFEEVSVNKLEENVCEALARSTKLRTLQANRIDQDVSKEALVALSSSLVVLSIRTTARCLPTILNAAAGTLRKVTLPMLSLPEVFQTKIAALSELTILIEDHSSFKLYPTFASHEPWWTNYKEAESLEVVTLSWVGCDGAAPQSERFLLGLDRYLFCRKLKRINFRMRLPLERLVESIGVLPATPPVQELGWTGLAHRVTEMQLGVIRGLCNLAGIEFYPVQVASWY
ncbi:hypothetical protein JCM5353_002599 [Sporobolomyces roseus]